MKIIKSDSEAFERKFELLLTRRTRAIEKLGEEVDAIFKDYRERKEGALVDLIKEYDGVELDAESLWVDPDQIKNAHKLVTPEVKASIEATIERVERFQQEIKQTSFQTQDESGVYWGIEIRALDRVGIYVPKNYFLAFILSVVPARIAGVDEIIIATPPQKDLGEPYIDPATLYVAKKFEINKILLSGGPAAMAALAFGTSSTKPVQKVVGPSRRLGLVAKQRLSGYVGIDGLTGPAEVAFVCDKSSSVEIVASDIVGMADHNPDAQIFVFNTSEDWMENLLEEIVKASENLKDKEGREGVRNCLESNTHLFVFEDLNKSFQSVNRLSPGFVVDMTENPSEHISKITSCGSLLLGAFTPVVATDIIGGATGLVPTLGASAFSSMSSPATFTRKFSVMHIEEEALSRLRDKSQALSAAEGFSTHKSAFESRLK